MEQGKGKEEREGKRIVRQKGGMDENYSVIASAEQSAITCDGDTGHRHVFFRDELMRTFILAQVPDAHVARAIAGNQLALVGMDDDIVDGRDVRKDVADGGAVGVVALDTAGARVPDLHGAVLGAGHHPFPLAVEGDAGDVVGVSVKGQHGTRVRRADVVELDVVVARRG